MLLKNSFYEIDITEDHTYRLFSVDNKPYNQVFQMEDYGCNSCYRTLAISVLDLREGNLKNIAFIGGMYSFTTQNCAALDGHELAVLIQDTVAIIDLNKLILLEKNKVLRGGTAYHMYPYKGSYVIHGEMEIVLILKERKLFGAFLAGIFLRSPLHPPEDKGNLTPFTIDGDYIIAYDWDGNKYVLDENGREIS